MSPEEIEKLLLANIGPEDEGSLAQQIHRLIMKHLLVKIDKLAAQEELPNDGLTQVLAELIEQIMTGIAPTCWRMTREDHTAKTCGDVLGTVLTKIFELYDKQGTPAGDGAQTIALHVRQLHQVYKIKQFIRGRSSGGEPRSTALN